MSVVKSVELLAKARLNQSVGGQRQPWSRRNRAALGDSPGRVDNSETGDTATIGPAPRFASTSPVTRTSRG